MTVAMVSSRSGSCSSDLLGPPPSRPHAYDARNHRELTLTYLGRAGRPRSQQSLDRLGANANPERGATQLSEFPQLRAQPTSARTLRPNSLCARSERIIFSCLTKRSGVRSVGGSSKIVSLCASRDLDKERGYLQYRYGLPDKVELEFPSLRTGTQQMFQYTHYMRYQVDLTEINFAIDGYQYQIFDDYNGEEKPRISTEGVSVTAPGKPREVSFVCRTKAKADYSMLDEVLIREQ
jgi:hypothetical protein